ncbi:hypothetical protein [Nocardia sp. NPDC046763]|uniref:hypothetical protein n=1 Tax=Nocardia sp. NPDC046763 TaxID=3155256 RepID=UPI003401E73E
MSRTPSTRGRPAKNGTKVGASLPADLVSAAEHFGRTHEYKPGETVEVLLEIGIRVVPPGHGPIDGYDKSKGKKYIWGTPGPQLAASVLAPVHNHETSITRRLWRLLHFALIDLGYDLPKPAASEQLSLTGT